MRWEAVFFDFDGVIVDSVNVKAEAFAELFRKHGPEIENKVVDFHLKHGGMSRFEKFRYWYKEYLGLKITESEEQKLSKRFSEISLNKVIKAPYIGGAIESLMGLKRKGIPVYIVSGTPEEEIKYIVKARDLAKYFLEVHGSPRHKTEIVADIIGRKNYLPARCMFIGDALSDYEAAIKNRINFLGVVTKGNKSPFPSNVKITNIVHVAEDLWVD
jgi:HAD superfamily hydrolase (TIGR01549 family)